MIEHIINLVFVICSISSLLSEAGVQDTTIKKIVGHSGAMSMTEKVYTHLDVKVLIDAINEICKEPKTNK